PHRDLPSFPTRRSSDLCSSMMARLRSSTTVIFALGSSASATICIVEPFWTTTVFSGVFSSAQVATDLPFGEKTPHASVKIGSQRSEEHTSELQSRENLV